MSKPSHECLILDAKTGNIQATISIGKGSDAIAYDPETKLAFSSNGEGSVTVVHEDSPNRFSANNFVTQEGARTMALDLKTHKLYLMTAKYQPMSPPVAGQEIARPLIDPSTAAVLVLGKSK